MNCIWKLETKGNVSLRNVETKGNVGLRNVVDEGNPTFSHTEH